ncbi:YqcC family protein [Phytopseudomonas dryadis]|uniref:Pseudouridine synthase n=1 Tax=Phytopseudomonas dryadis TaxID=2487520 RepID=A0ABY1ZAU7_9GAMM|nr:MULTISPECIES: YqcC family protein [Pseudomonas]TBV08890.1 pseudouridine synthase [Pseudomonas dryadis]TBV15075.1 pseudouridine synthase [Pseudomonas sp. FRB 230]
MAASVALIADQLLLIERALRVQGWWEAQAPSAEALSSREPFCVDTLAFEQWLQWIFLPKMKSILESGADLPAVSGIQPMAEQVYGAGNRDVAELLEVLGEFDRLITAG